MLPSDEEIQRAVTEAVTGVIALDNTLVVARHFGALPDEVVVVEVEPGVQEFGDTFSDAVGRGVRRRVRARDDAGDGRWRRRAAPPRPARRRAPW